MLTILKAKHLGKYKIEVAFNNGKAGEIDLEETISNDHRAIFQALKDMEQFKNFKLQASTLVWSNGLDIAPEYLYFKAFKNDPELRALFQEWGYMD